MSERNPQTDEPAPRGTAQTNNHATGERAAPADQAAPEEATSIDEERGAETVTLEFELDETHAKMLEEIRASGVPAEETIALNSVEGVERTIYEVWMQLRNAN